MATVLFYGRVFATPSAATILIDGTEVFSGQVGVGQPLDTNLTLYSANISVAQGSKSTVPVSISVTSGIITVGHVLPTNDPLFLGQDLRNNDILLNGQAPEWPATPVNPMPGGTPSAPIWDGWYFEVSAGESVTFTMDVLGTPLVWTANTNYTAGQYVSHQAAENVIWIVNADCNSGPTFNASQFTYYETIPQ